MRALKDNPFLDGSVMSEELTSIQKQLAVYIDYPNKLARTRAEQQALLKLEKPAGQEVYLKALEREELQRGKKLSETEKKKLEKQTKYDLKVSKLGNATQIFNAMFSDFTAENKHYHQLIDSAKKEIERLCTQTGAINKAQAFDPKEHL